jgi:hypothetical protein
VDDDSFTLALLKQGTYRYTSIQGAMKTVRRYSAARPITFKQYMAYRRKGYKEFAAP